ncbi:DUF1993 domain-containing protein [Aliiglaciecola sp. M165]|uniref:DUF1993 domain-containing protein n=1 Tax=Aliiglaciecola sp. M165 TaxID=2593649 RepID=UPI00117DA14D|nr:DUF1993 domain-containing protein [Aliiglaciecola sp. M165]TRY32610.1 DUF1993 domain-containing protein [Aliiglaciecola sp. M165]
MEPIEIFERYLNQLITILEKAQGFCAEQTIKETELLEERLAPDMFPLKQQISTAINFTIRICAPLANNPHLNVPINTKSFADCIASCEQMIQRLYELEIDQHFADNLPMIQSTSGFQENEFHAMEYIYAYGLPNFIFHLSMVYSILRKNGVPLSKGDFDGYHAYPEGFYFDAD